MGAGLRVTGHWSPVTVLESEPWAALRLLRAALEVSLQPDDNLRALLQGPADDLAVHAVAEPDAHVHRRGPAGVVEHPDTSARRRAASAGAARGHPLVARALLGIEYLRDTRSRVGAQALRLAAAFRGVLRVDSPDLV